MVGNVFIELCLVMTIATICSFILKSLKQPLIVGYIFTGIIAGPVGLHIIQSGETLELFSKIGIITLLFIVGLHLSPKVISEVGKVSLITGLGQIIFTSLIGFGIVLASGWSVVESLYIAIALTFSSTIIILKLLTDKGDLHTLYGRIAVGFLLVQDVVAAVILILVATLAGTTGESGWFIFLLFLLKAFLLSGLYIITSRWILPTLLRFASQTTELLFLFSITWAIGYSALFYYLNLSVEMGALIAGVSLSSSFLASQISSRLTPLRDFFITLFFIYLGSSMNLEGASALIVPVILLSLFVLVGNPLIVVFLMNMLGYHRKTGFFAGLTVAQISEFSLILATLGYAVGHVSSTTLTLITLVGLITIAGSTYLILYADKIYNLIDPILKRIEWQKGNNNKNKKISQYDVLIFGFKQQDTSLLEFFQKLDYKTAVIDFNPELRENILASDTDHVYGDAGSIEFLESLPLTESKLVISGISSKETNQLLIQHTLNKNPHSIIVVFADIKEHVATLYEWGATYVISPAEHGAIHAMKTIQRYGFQKGYYEQKNKTRY